MLHLSLDECFELCASQCLHVRFSGRGNESEIMNSFKSSISSDTYLDLRWTESFFGYPLKFWTVRWEEVFNHLHGPAILHSLSLLVNIAIVKPKSFYDEYRKSVRICSAALQKLSNNTLDDSYCSDFLARVPGTEISNANDSGACIRSIAQIRNWKHIWNTSNVFHLCNGN